VAAVLKITIKPRKKIMVRRKTLYRASISALCLLGAYAIAPAFAQDAPAPETTWVGEFRIGGKATAITLHDRSAVKGVASVLDIPAMGARDVPLANYAMTATRSHFELQGGPDLYTFDGAPTKAGMGGTVKQGAASGDFTLVKVLATDAALNRKLSGSYQIAPGHVIDIGMMSELGGQLVFLDQKTLRQGPLTPLTQTRFASGPTLGVAYPFAIHVEFVKDAKGAVKGLRWQEGQRTFNARKIAPHRVEEVTVVNGDVTLKGTLLLPLKPGPHPAVVFAHGSGDAKRDVGMWNMFFVRQGIAVLSLDKRGVGESGGDWHTASLGEIADDWLAGVAMLKQRADIDPKRIGVHGSSQGGWTAPDMAVRSTDIAYVIVRAGSANTVVDTMVHEVGWAAREAGSSEAEALEAEAGSRTMFGLVGAPWSEFNAAATPMKSKPWANAAWNIHMTEKGWGRGWSVKNASIDPAATLAKVQVPVLWFLGDLDHNVPSASTAKLLDAARTASGNKDFTVVHMADAGHSFIASKTGNNSEFPMATHFAAGYWDTMEAWLRAHRFSRP
jgi:dienelactone hydrolase